MMKLSEYQVVLIRLRAANGIKGIHLAAEFGVTPGCISGIVNGRLRRDLPGPRTSQGPRRPYGSMAKLTEEQVVQVREVYAAGQATQTALASQYDVWPVTIRRIVNGETHQHVGGPITHRHRSKKRAGN